MEDHIGFVLYEGKSLIGSEEIVCIATLESKNGKTGNMVQVWIVPKDEDPLDAVQHGQNSGACGRCALQGKWDEQLQKMVGRVCYVNLGQAPKQIYRSYKAGKYSKYNRRIHEFLLVEREIRLGAYGDPAALPVPLVRYFATVGSGWTGYSHQLFWIDQRRANELAKYVMCSCHTKAQHAEARRRGWRSFVAIHEGQSAPEGAVECPYYTHEVQCIDCQLCQGTSKRAKDVYVISHGKVGANLPAVQQMQGDLLDV